MTMNAGFGGEPIRVVDSIAYQEDAVVSKILLKTEMGTVTLFAFAEGQELSEHTAPFDALVHVVEGTAEIRICEDSHQVGAGEALVMPANQPHALRAVEGFKMILTMLKADSESET